MPDGAPFFVHFFRSFIDTEHGRSVNTNPFDLDEPYTFVLYILYIRNSKMVIQIAIITLNSILTPPPSITTELAEITVFVIFEPPIVFIIYHLIVRLIPTRSGIFNPTMLIYP